MMSAAPPVAVYVPFFNVPDESRFQLPVAADNARFPVSVPVRFTVPPVRLNVPKVAWVKLPPRLTVELVAEIVPALLQALSGDVSPRLRVAEVAVMLAPAGLVQVPPSASVVPAGPVRPRLF